MTFHVSLLRRCSDVLSLSSLDHFSLHAPFLHPDSTFQNAGSSHDVSWAVGPWRGWPHLLFRVQCLAWDPDLSSGTSVGTSWAVRIVVS